jgi:hypothetical protein
VMNSTACLFPSVIVPVLSNSKVTLVQNRF